MRLITLALAPLVLLPSQAITSPETPYIAHEWGTFTTIAGAHGAALDWRPLSGPSDLPTFVYKDLGPSGRGKGEHAAVRMETPVVYFYAGKHVKVSARVDFPGGRITEWYPQAAAGDGVDWGTFTVLGGSPSVDLLHESAPSHYYPARDVDANLVRVCKDLRCQHERFLFYRGLGTFDLPLNVELSGADIKVRAQTAAPVGTVFVFERSGAKVGFTSVQIGREATLGRPALDDKLDTLLVRLEEALVGQGLYRKEAAAMVATWRDSWFEDGLRVLYFLPRAATDRVLPLVLTPAPAELVRVIVGRVELITPELEARVLTDLTRLDDKTVRNRYGRFAEPILKKLAGSHPALRPRIERLLAD
jgi:hypothetical protein